MEVDKKTYMDLKKLEESLWVRSTRFDRGYMESILSNDFFEFGRSGKTYNREQILSATDCEIDAKLPFNNFQISIIGEGVFLVTYISEVQYEELEIGNRSSIWIKTEAGYKLSFHQGTAVIQYN